MVSFYTSILRYEKETLDWNEIRIQKLDKQYLRKCKYEVVLKVSKIFNQI